MIVSRRRLLEAQLTTLQCVNAADSGKAQWLRHRQAACPPPSVPPSRCIPGTTAVAPVGSGRKAWAPGTAQTGRPVHRSGWGWDRGWGRGVFSKHTVGVFVWSCFLLFTVGNDERWREGRVPCRHVPPTQLSWLSALCRVVASLT